MAETTDDDLARRVRDGDRVAFEQLVHRHLPSIHRYLSRLTGSADDADELTQETFLRLWQRAGSFRPGKARLTTWLHRIAHNLAVDGMRRHHRSGRVNGAATVAAPEADASEMPAGDPLSNQAGPAAGPAVLAGPEEQALQAQSRRLLDAALATLPESQRTALVLCQVQGLSNGEAAAVLGTTVRAVESLLARARRSLRAAVLESDGR